MQFCIFCPTYVSWKAEEILRFNQTPLKHCVTKDRAINSKEKQYIADRKQQFGPGGFQTCTKAKATLKV